jgi:hypothetical protein
MALVISSLLSFFLSQFIASLILVASTVSLLIAHAMFLKYRILTRKSMDVPIIQILTTSNISEAFFNAILFARLGKMSGKDIKDIVVPLIGLGLVVIHTVSTMAIPLIITETPYCKGYLGAHSTLTMDAGNVGASIGGAIGYQEVLNNRSSARVPPGTYLKHSPVEFGWRYSKADNSDIWNMSELSYESGSYSGLINNSAFFQPSFPLSALPELDDEVGLSDNSTGDSLSYSSFAPVSATKHGKGIFVVFFSARSNSTDPLTAGTKVLLEYGVAIADRNYNVFGLGHNGNTSPLPPSNGTIYLQLRKTLATRVVDASVPGGEWYNQKGEYPWYQISAVAMVQTMAGAVIGDIIRAILAENGTEYYETEWFGPEQLATYMQAAGTSNGVLYLDKYALAKSCVSINYVYVAVLIVGWLLYLEIIREFVVIQHGNQVLRRRQVEARNNLSLPGTSSGWMGISVKEYLNSNHVGALNDGEVIALAVKSGMRYGLRIADRTTHAGVIGGREEPLLRSATTSEIVVDGF